jgi:hypothetical protein
MPKGCCQCQNQHGSMLKRKHSFCPLIIIIIIVIIIVVVSGIGIVIGGFKTTMGVFQAGVRQLPRALRRF